MEAEDDKPVDAAKAVCILDYSKARRGPLQLLAVFLWSGWMAFYFFFPAIAGVLYLYAPVVLAALIGLMVISALTTVDPRRQPKVSASLCSAPLPLHPPESIAHQWTPSFSSPALLVPG